MTFSKCYRRYTFRLKHGTAEVCGIFEAWVPSCTESDSCTFWNLPNVRLDIYNRGDVCTDVFTLTVLRCMTDLFGPEAVATGKSHGSAMSSVQLLVSCFNCGLLRLSDLLHCLRHLGAVLAVAICR